MRIISLLALAIFISTLPSSCMPGQPAQTQENIGQEPGNDGNESEENTKPQEQSMTIHITVGGKTFKADIEDTETGRAFISRLPITLDMSDLNGNEKYCYGVSLPKADKYYDSIAAGDLMLYSGNCIVLFYAPAGGYSYTRLGRLGSTEGLKAALGTGSVKVSFSPAPDGQ